MIGEPLEQGARMEMSTKRMVLWGMVITALMASLTISVAVPEYILAMWILLLGLGFTYYYALNHKRLEYIQKQGILLEANGIFTPEFDPLDISARGVQLAARLVPCQEVFIWDGQIKYADAPPSSWEGWAKLAEAAGDSRVRVYSSGDEPEAISLPDAIYSLAAIPLYIEGIKPRMLYLVNRQGEKAFTQRDIRLIHLLHKQLILALQNYNHLYRERAFSRQVLETVIDATETRFPENIGHARRVTSMALLMGKKLALEAEEMMVLEYSALLHDIGYAGVRSGEEGEEIDHASAGAAMISGEGIWTDIRETIRSHHERYDGSGYPRGLLRNDIPFTARIIAVADLYDAMTRLAGEDILSHEQAVRVIKKGTGTYFDPLVVVAFEEVEDLLRAESQMEEA